MPVDQRIANGEILRQARERVVDRLVAVRVVVAHHVADDLGALDVAALRIEAQFAHRVEDAAVNGLQAVAHVGKRAVHDRRKGVGQITLFESGPQLDGLDRAIARQNRFCSHVASLQRAPGRPQASPTIANSVTSVAAPFRRKPA